MDDRAHLPPRPTSCSPTTFADAGSSPFPPFVNISQCAHRGDPRRAHRRGAADRRAVGPGGRRHRAGRRRRHAALRRTAGACAGRAYVVACAGARGDALRATLGVTFDGPSFDDHFLICDIRTDLPGLGDRAAVLLRPRVEPRPPGARPPLPGSARSASTGRCPPATTSTPRWPPARSTARIRADHRRPADYEIVWKSVYRFHSRIASTGCGSGGCCSRATPRTSCRRSARAASTPGWPTRRTPPGRSRYVGYGWAPEELLESYHAERHAAALENIAVTDGDHGLPRAAATRSAGAPAPRCSSGRPRPGVHAQVDSGRLAEPYWYPDRR